MALPALLPILSAVLPFLGKALDTGSEVINKVEDNKHAEQTALLNAYASEFAKTERTYFDSFVDGANRLVRPTFTLGTASLFVWCAADPVAFSVAMTALALVPDPLWMMLSVILGFWFGGRLVEGITQPKASAKQVAEVLQSINAIRSIDSPKPVLTEAQQADATRRNTESVADTLPITDAQLAAELADETKPMTLDSIVAWNRRNNPNFKE